jgi:hypothetical protein
VGVVGRWELSTPCGALTHGRRGQMGARDTTEATATTSRSHSTRGEALVTSSSDIHVDLWFMLDFMLDLSYLCGFVISVDFDMFHV